MVSVNNKQKHGLTSNSLRNTFSLRTNSSSWGSRWSLEFKVVSIYAGVRIDLFVLTCRCFRTFYTDFFIEINKLMPRNHAKSKWNVCYWFAVIAMISPAMSTKNLWIERHWTYSLRPFYLKKKILVENNVNASLFDANVIKHFINMNIEI